jgi:hypothetical protein
VRGKRKREEKHLKLSIFRQTLPRPYFLSHSTRVVFAINFLLSLSFSLLLLLLLARSEHACAREVPVCCHDDQGSVNENENVRSNKNESLPPHEPWREFKESEGRNKEGRQNLVPLASSMSSSEICVFLARINQEMCDN